MNDLLSDIERDIDRDWSLILEEENKKGSDFFYGSVFETLDRLIALNKKNRERLSNWKCNDPHYFRDFCTVVFDIGRQVGKTEYIKSTANETDDLIIVVRCTA